LLVEWLGYLHQADEDVFHAFRDSLALGGQTGTLRNRFGKYAVKSEVRAKSGYMRGVCTLSGYLIGPNGRTIAFSILVNDIPDGVETRQAKELQERILQVFDQQLQAEGDAVLVETDGTREQPKVGG
jgi:D-alanyl-D-alanine carboxypeptidase/D-alanyl-D-alanine-endopeptidase (penicillin-binding protein 4)